MAVTGGLPAMASGRDHGWSEGAGGQRRREVVPIDEDDIHDQLKDLLGAATIPATIATGEVMKSSAHVNGLSISESHGEDVVRRDCRLPRLHLRRYETLVNYRSVSGVVGEKEWLALWTLKIPGARENSAH